MKIDKNYYPGFVRKAITFTIDDGNIQMDKKFVEILADSGIKGTFNLCSPKANVTHDEYRELYRGFGIANHCKNHPFALEPDVEYKFSDDPFNAETANEELLYNAGDEGYYYLHISRGWRKVASYETYVRYIDECLYELEEIFGKGNIKGFVWPFCQQSDTRILDYIKKAGYNSARKTGQVSDTTGFSTPADRFTWSYNATDSTLLDVAALYRDYPDDGKLKYFSFGVHSVDFEVNGTWGNLKEFVKNYGYRPETYWYATVDEIFEYEDAVNRLIIEKDSIYNGSDLTLYIKIDGEPITIAPKSSYGV